MLYVNRGTLEQVLEKIGSSFSGPGTVYLIGETSLVWSGARPWTDEVEIAISRGESRGEAVEDTLRAISHEAGVKIVHEPPDEVIPLPEGWQDSCRPTDHKAGEMDVAHFDPYSVSYRFLARGDEEDYKLVISFLENGWIEMGEMDRQLTELLPRFSFETIAQDPAEFRRKYKGLRQMAKAKGLA